MMWHLLRSIPKYQVWEYDLYWSLMALNATGNVCWEASEGFELHSMVKNIILWLFWQTLRLRYEKWIKTDKQKVFLHLATQDRGVIWVHISHFLQKTLHIRWKEICLRLTDSPHPHRDNSETVISDKKESGVRRWGRGNWPFPPLERNWEQCKKNTQSQEKPTVAIKTHSQQRSQTEKFQRKRRRRRTLNKLGIGSPWVSPLWRRTTHKSSSQWIRAVSCHPPPQGTGPV